MYHKPIKVKMYPPVIIKIKKKLAKKCYSSYEQKMEFTNP